MNRLFPVCLLALLAVLPASAQQAWWGLWNSGMGLSQRTTLNQGRNELSVRLTAQNSPLLVGGEVHALRFFIADKSLVRSASVWASASNAAGAARTIVSKDVAAADLRDIATDGEPTVVALDEPLTLLPKGNPYVSVYVGVTIELTAAGQAQGLPLLAGDGTGAANSSFINTQDRKAYGALPLQVLVSNAAVPEYSLEPLAIDRQTTVKGTAATVAVTLRNVGMQPVSTIGCTVTIDGTAQENSSLTPRPSSTTPVDELGLTFTVPVSYTAPSTAEEHRLEVAVTSVNGQPNAAATASREARLMVLERNAEKRTVMEEFTGTWCHNCIRGMVGIELMEQAFGDRFIAVALHGDDRDPMMVPAIYGSQFFRDKIRSLGGYPSCTIDRYIDGDPYCGLASSGPFATDGLVEWALSQPAVADIALAARWADDGSQTIDCDVLTTFLLSMSGEEASAPPYSVALYLLADGLKGEGGHWRQTNGYDDYSGTDEALLPFAGKGHYLTDIDFSHVAIQAAGIDGGIDGSIATPIVAGATQHFDYSMDVSANSLIQDRERLTVVAMLIDSSDGSVVNAVKAKVATDASAIADAVGDRPAAGPSTLYDLHGRRLATPPSSPGIYIRNGRKTFTYVSSSSFSVERQ